MKTIEEFLRNLLPHERSNISFQNESIDVALKDCFFYPDQTACIRNSLLTLFGFLSLIFCSIRIAKLHIFHHAQVHQYLIFYAAIFEIIFLMIKWLALNDVFQIEFVACYLKMLQFLFLYHFHWSLVSRILHRQKLITWIMLPVLVVYFAIFSAITVLAMMSKYTTWEECLAPHWIVLSFIEFIGIQLFLVSGVYITKNINHVRSEDYFKREQKIGLWSVILTYEVSSIVTSVYYIVLHESGDEEIGCSGIFGHVQHVYSLIYATVMILKYLLPIWVMLFIYYPTRGCMTSEDQTLLGWSATGSTTSMFNRSSRFLDSYKQLVLPDQNVLYVDGPGIRRSESSPAIFSRPSLGTIIENETSQPRSHIIHADYGAADSFRSQPETAVIIQTTRSRIRHDSGAPVQFDPRNKTLHVPVSLNHCSDEMESVTPSSCERA
ncbi:hypothetical protein JTE90_027617 [Oedothorax gibbosus]|uniref:Transmembrane protein n=1 Tax=Oedothorax gibbosus TaxID=931172 RepID=A0AAV6VLL5_9ARAC|nr:hypothetical protein JTE90_027617 [Oedothorax gibbosus]